MIGIIGALEEEVELLKNDMQIRECIAIAGCEYTCGTLNGQDLVVTHCGMGKVNAASCTTVMIERFSPEIIINTGVGGSLDTALKVCDIAIAEDVIQYDYNLVPLGYLPGQVDLFESPFFVCDERINKAIKASTDNLGYTSFFSRFATGDRFVDDPSEKCILSETYGAKVCEMETGAIAQVCALFRVRFSSIRTISDSGSEDDGVMQFRKFLTIASTHSVQIIEDLFKHIQEIL